MKLKYTFLTKKVMDEAVPLIIAEKPYDILLDLSFGHLLTIENIERELSNIENVVIGNVPEYTFGGVEVCLLTVNKLSTKVIDVFHAQVIGELPTQDVIELLKDWKTYLENFNIAK